MPLKSKELPSRVLLAITNDNIIVSSGKDTVLEFEGSAALKNGKLIERISSEESQSIT